MLTPHHTLREFDHALTKMNDKILKMASCCRLSLDLAAQALLGRDENAANQAIVADEEIDEFELLVDKEGMTILAGFSPVAGDLRLVLTLIRLSGILERIGDCSVSISRRSKNLLKVTEIREARLAEPVFRVMGDYLNSLSTALAVRDFDTVKAELDKADEYEDQVHVLTARFTSLADLSGGSLAEYAELIFISRSLEAVSLYLRRMATEILYIETAQRG